MKPKLALISLLLGIFSFIHLLGIEKAVLAIIFGTWALKESIEVPRDKKLAWTGITLGLIYLVFITVVTIYYFPQLSSMVSKLK